MAVLPTAICTTSDLPHKNQRYDFFTFTTDNSDLPGNSVQSLTLGADGGLWVGTFRGLARWHEGAWQVFTPENSDLPDYNVRSIAMGADGALWAGTSRGGLARLHVSAWQIFTTDNSDLPGNSISSLMLGADSGLWIGTYSGLAHWHKGAWRVFTTDNSGLPSNNILSLTVGADSDLWVGTYGGLARWHEGTWRVFTTESSDLPGNKIWGLTLSADGGLWVGTDDGLARLHEGTWQVFTHTNSGLPDISVTSLTLGADGDLWVGTFGGGLARLNEGAWQVFTYANNALPDIRVSSLTLGADGDLWVGTFGGLAHWHEGTWQIFTTANSGLPHNFVKNLMLGADGSLWVGTLGSGLVHSKWAVAELLIRKINTLAEIRQSEHTFAVRGFDPSYHSPSHFFHYNWTVSRRGSSGSEKAVTARTSEPFYTAAFHKDGDYRIKVQASDRYGWLSNTEIFDIRVILKENEQTPWWRTRVVTVGVSAIPPLYLFLLLPLIWFYPNHSWARSLVNSGVFSKFPVLHHLLFNTRWARCHLFARYRQKVLQTPELTHYIEQSLFSISDGEALPVGHEDSPSGGLSERGRFSLVVGRSGTGKSILLARVQRASAAIFGRYHAVLPVMVNAPIHLGGGETLMDAIKTALRRDGNVELTESTLSYLIRMGGFLVLVDSLNEYPQAATALTAFLNADANNTVIIASQTDVLHHPDVNSYRLAEVTIEQAKDHLDKLIETGTWDKLPDPLKSLAQNPKDLDLIAEVITNLGVEGLPTRRADLYAERLRVDTAVRPWIETADPRLEIIYSLAFRMLVERRAVELPTLAQWIKDALSNRKLELDEVKSVMTVLQRSRQFREVNVRNRIGREQDAITFDHELVGKFLAARQVYLLLHDSASRPMVLELATDKAWQDVFLFVIDETKGSELPELLLNDLIECTDASPFAILAYAISTKSNDQPPLPPEIRDRYNKARLKEDVKLTYAG